MPAPPDHTRWEQNPDGSYTRRRPNGPVRTPSVLPIGEDFGLASLGAAHPPAMLGAESAPIAGTSDATSAAVELASEIGVDLRSVEGTGSGGRITKSDVEAAVGATD